MVITINLDGHSMGNKFPPGQYLLDIDSNEYHVGDVILYESKFSSTGFVVHRIISFDNSLIITKGDDNNYEDYPIQIDKVIGKIVIKNYNECKKKHD